MDRELVLKESKEVLALGQQFLKGIQHLQTYDKTIVYEIEELVSEGDEEFVAINNDFAQLFKDLP